MISVKVESQEERDAVIDKALKDEVCAITWLQGVLIMESKELAATLFRHLATGYGKMYGGQELVAIMRVTDDKNRDAIGVGVGRPMGVYLYGINDEQFMEIVRKDENWVDPPSGALH